jgi:hypothetical protein
MMSNTPFEYFSTHLQVLGWPALLFFAWQVARYFERITAQASKTIGQIDTLATNHMPHMEESLKNQDGLLHSIDTSLKTIADNSRRRREDF